MHRILRHLTSRSLPILLIRLFPRHWRLRFRISQSSHIQLLGTSNSFQNALVFLLDLVLLVISLPHEEQQGNRHLSHSYWVVSTMLCIAPPRRGFGLFAHATALHETSLQLLHVLQPALRHGGCRQSMHVSPALFAFADGNASFDCHLRQR